MERRAEKRKQIATLDVEHIIDNETYKKVFHRGEMLNTSLTGFLVQVYRAEICEKSLRQSLSLDSLIGTSISLYVPNMDLELDGVVKLTRHIGKGVFEVLVSFSADTPQYWRECLMDLLPQPGELEEA